MGRSSSAAVASFTLLNFLVEGIIGMLDLRFGNTIFPFRKKKKKGNTQLSAFPNLLCFSVQVRAFSEGEGFEKTAHPLKDSCHYWCSRRTLTRSK